MNAGTQRALVVRDAEDERDGVLALVRDPADIRHRILVIEDDPDVRELLVEILREVLLDLRVLEEIEVLSAEDGRTGLELARRYVPGVILVDRGSLGDMSGADVLRGKLTSHTTTGL